MALKKSGVELVAKGVDKFVDDLGDANNAVGSFAKETDQSSSSFASFGKAISSFAIGGVISTAITSAVSSISSAILDIGRSSIETAISFESAFTGVTKTIDGLSDNFGKLTDYGREIRQEFVDLSKTIPLSFQELTAIGEIGGQLGIASDQIIQFTESIAQIGVATDLSAEEAATSLARFSSIFNVAEDQVGENIQKLGNTIVGLGNSFETTESEIVAFATRLAGAGKIAGLTQADVIGIGAAFTSLGITAEAGGTSVQRVLLQMNDAVNQSSVTYADNSRAIEKNLSKQDDLRRKLETLNANLVRLEYQTGLSGDELLSQRQAFIDAGGAAEEYGRLLGDKNRQKVTEAALKIQDVTRDIQNLTYETERLRAAEAIPIDTGNLATFARVAEMTAEDFRKLYEQDASKAFELFVKGLGKQGDNAVKVLEELGIADQEVIRSFLTLASAGEKLEETIALANQEFESGTAAQDEAQKRYSETASKVEILWNNIDALRDQIGSQFLPIINDLIDFAVQFIDRFSDPISNAIQNNVIPLFTKAIDLFKRIIGFDLSIDISMPANDLGDELSRSLNFGDTLVVPSDFGASLSEYISTFIENQVEIIRNQSGKLAAAYWSWVDYVNQVAYAKLSEIAQRYVNWAGSPETQQKMMKVGESIGEYIVAAFGNYMSLSTDNIQQTLGNGLVIAIAGIGGSLIALGGEIAAGIVQGFVNGITGDDTIKVSTLNELVSLGEAMKQYDWDVIGQTIMDTIILGIVTVLPKINETLSQMRFIIQNAYDWNKLGVYIMTGILDGLDALPKFVEKKFLDMVSAVQSYLGISSPSTLFAGFGKNIIDGLISGITSNAGQLISTLTGLFSGGLFGGGQTETQIPAFASMDTIDFTSFLETINTTVPNSLLLLQEKINQSLLFITTTVTFNLQNWTLLLTTFMQNVTFMHTEFWTNLQFIWMNAHNIVTQMIIAFYATIIQLTTDFWSNMMNLTVSNISYWISVIEEASANLLQISQDTADGIWDAFDSKDWKSLGKSIGEGIEEGLREKKDDIVDLAREIASKALKAAKKVLDSGSPSKEFMKIGEGMIIGWEMGVSANAPKLIKAVSATGKGALDAASKYEIERRKRVDAAEKRFARTIFADNLDNLIDGYSSKIRDIEGGLKSTINGIVRQRGPALIPGERDLTRSFFGQTIGTEENTIGTGGIIDASNLPNFFGDTLGTTPQAAQQPVQAQPLVSINVGSINNGMDMAVFESRVREVVGGLA